MAIAIDKQHDTATLKSKLDGKLFVKESDGWVESSAKLYSGITTPTSDIGSIGDYYKYLKVSTNLFRYSDDFTMEWKTFGSDIYDASSSVTMFYTTPTILAGKKTNEEHGLEYVFSNNSSIGYLFSIYVKSELCHKIALTLSDYWDTCGCRYYFDLSENTQSKTTFNTSSSFVLQDEDGNHIQYKDGSYRLYVFANIKYASQLKIKINLVSEEGNDISFLSDTDYRILINNAQLSETSKPASVNNLPPFVITDGERKQTYYIYSIYKKDNDTTWNVKDISYYNISDSLSDAIGQENDIATYDTCISISPVTLLGTGGVSYLRQSSENYLITWDTSSESYYAKINGIIYKLPYTMVKDDKRKIIFAMALNQNAYETYNFGGSSYNPYSYSTEYGINPGGCYSIWQQM